MVKYKLKIFWLKVFKKTQILLSLTAASMGKMVQFIKVVKIQKHLVIKIQSSEIP